MHTWPRFRFRQERFTGHGYYLYNRTVLPKVRRYLCLLACRNDLRLVPYRCVLLAAGPLAWHNCKVTVTVLMTASNEARIRVIIVADDRTTRKVSELLRQLDIRWKIADRPEWPGSRTDGVLHCFTAQSVPVPLFPPAIVINKRGVCIGPRRSSGSHTRYFCDRVRGSEQSSSTSCDCPIDPRC